MSVVLRGEREIAAPTEVVLGFLERWRLEPGDTSARFDEADLRLANRGGARISAMQIATVLERRHTIGRALRTIPPDASLADRSVAWSPLEQLFAAFAGIHGFGLSKMTKALHPKRPALVPMLDSVVQRYLRDDDLGATAPFGERALAFTRGYKRDVDHNRAALRAVQGEVAGAGYDVTVVRILDLLIWSVETPGSPTGATAATKDAGLSW